MSDELSARERRVLVRFLSLREFPTSYRILMEFRTKKVSLETIERIQRAWVKGTSDSALCNNMAKIARLEHEETPFYIRRLANDRFIGIVRKITPRNHYPGNQAIISAINKKYGLKLKDGDLIEISLFERNNGLESIEDIQREWIESQTLDKIKDELVHNKSYFLPGRVMKSVVSTFYRRLKELIVRESERLVDKGVFPTYKSLSAEVGIGSAAIRNVCLNFLGSDFIVLLQIRWVKESSEQEFLRVVNTGLLFKSMIDERVKAAASERLNEIDSAIINESRKVKERRSRNNTRIGKKHRNRKVQKSKIVMPVGKGFNLLG